MELTERLYKDCYVRFNVSWAGKSVRNLGGKRIVAEGCSLRARVRGIRV